MQHTMSCEQPAACARLGRMSDAYVVVSKVPTTLRHVVREMVATVYDAPTDEKHVAYACDVDSEKSVPRHGPALARGG